MFLTSQLYNNDSEPTPDTITNQFEQLIINPTVVYGNANAFNIQIKNLSGGGYYVQIYDGTTPIFQRRGKSSDTNLYNGASGATTNAPFLDRFTSFSYDKFSKTLTLTGAVDTYSGITYTRQEVYQFISDYIIKDIWSISSDIDGACLFTNWNYYTSINSVWDIDNNNFGDGTAKTPFGIAVQLVSSGPLYGCLADNPFNIQRNNQKRALASQSGIACTWAEPGDVVNWLYSVNSHQTSLTQYIFKSQPTFYDLMLQSQLAVGVTKGYSGSLWDKICQITNYLNIGSITDFATYKLQPSWFNDGVNGNYTVGMFSRDSFWQSLSKSIITNAIESNCIASFEASQLGSGQILTRTGPGGSGFHDESTLFYIIRNYFNKTNRGLSLNTTDLQKAFDYVLTQVTNDAYINNSGSTQSWNDNFVFSSGGYSGYVQGLLCVAYKCALALGLTGITQTNLTNAITKYQALYDSNNLYIKFTSDTTYMSPDVLVGEALSLYLFNTKLLTDTQVNNHVAKLVSLSSTAQGLKNISNSADGSYLDPGAFSPTSVQGEYQNGGSWFLYDYLAFYAARQHGYSLGQQYMDQRIATEIVTDPVSHEYAQTLNTLPNYPSETAKRHGYSWNTASFVIK